MKKTTMQILTALLLLMTMLASLFGCAAGGTETTGVPGESTQGSQTPAAQMFATAEEAQKLDGLYSGRVAYHGDIHDHADTGGKSDGHNTLTEWKTGLQDCFMDFAGILDHKQTLHMRLPEWDNAIFIGGTEAAARITDSKATSNSLHYNMTFATPEPLEEILHAFPEYKFDGTHFSYPGFTTARFQELIAMIKAKGGFFSNVHPKQTMQSSDPLDYYFAERTGIEVFYQDMESDKTQANYKLWTDLLALGKKVYATAGGDGHRMPDFYALTTIYSEKKDAASYVDYLRKGDFICGPVGIKMAIGDTTMGGECSFEGQKILFCVSDFHEYVRNERRTFRVDLINDKGVVYSQDINCASPAYFAVDADKDSAFYRVEVYDYRRECQIALGNPIWNTK